MTTAESTRFAVGDLVLIKIHNFNTLPDWCKRVNNQLCILCSGPWKDDKGRLHWSGTVSINDPDSGQQTAVTARVYEDWLEHVSADNIREWSETQQLSLEERKIKLLELKKRQALRGTRAYNLELD